MKSGWALLHEVVKLKLESATIKADDILSRGGFAKGVPTIEESRKSGRYRGEKEAFKFIDDLMTAHEKES